MKDEGNDVWSYSDSSEADCIKRCDQNEKCKSFTFCEGNQCHLKDKHLDGTEAKKHVARCHSWYRSTY